MLGSPFLFLSFAVDRFDDGDASKLGAALGLLFAIGWFSSVLGLARLGAVGTNKVARGVLMVEIVGAALASVFQVYEFFSPGSDSVLYTITDIAWPLSMVLLLVTGIIMVRARVFEGWLRFTPLIAALWLPLAVVELVIVGKEVGAAIGGLHTALGWFLMGYAVRSGGRLAERD
jgi:hypothetical protein